MLAPTTDQVIGYWETVYLRTKNRLIDVRMKRQFNKLVNLLTIIRKANIEVPAHEFVDHDQAWSTMSNIVSVKS